MRERSCVEPLGHWRSDGRSSAVSGLQLPLHAVTSCERSMAFGERLPSVRDCRQRHSPTRCRGHGGADPGTGDLSGQGFPPVQDGVEHPACQDRLVGDAVPRFLRVAREVVQLRAAAVVVHQPLPFPVEHRQVGGPVVSGGVVERLVAPSCLPGRSPGCPYRSFDRRPKGPTACAGRAARGSRKTACTHDGIVSVVPDFVLRRPGAKGITWNRRLRIALP